MDFTFDEHWVEPGVWGKEWLTTALRFDRAELKVGVAIPETKQKGSYGFTRPGYAHSLTPHMPTP